MQFSLDRKMFCFPFQATQVLSICTQNLAKIMGNVDPNQQTVSKSVPALIDWGQNLFALAERFEADAKSQLAASLEKEHTQPENCSIRMTMGDIYEKVLFFLNHMTHSYIDYSRSESPMSASYEAAQIIPAAGALQRFRSQQQQQYRRWSEAAATSMNESTESNVDSNRRWSMPTNVRQTRSIPTIMKPQAGLQSSQLSQSSIGDHSLTCSDGISEAIQLLSLTTRPSQSRPPSQHCLQPPPFTSQYRTPNQSQRTQRQPRGELNEILLLQRPGSDSGYFGRCQQIAENVRGESDENQ